MPPKIDLETLGWDAGWEEQFVACRNEGRAPGRVAVEDKHQYAVVTAEGELCGRLAGKLLHQWRSAAGLPKVGDWVALTPMPAEEKAVIHQVLPRRNQLSRKVPGREVEEQVIAANIDLAFLVQALDASFNPHLMERQLVMVLDCGARPVVLLNKADLCADIPEKVALAKRCAGEAPIFVVSARTGQSLEGLHQFIRPGETMIFIGSSGVGKSSLINRLYGREILATADVRESDAKGRHTTSWREMILLPEGGLVIDTPGVREFHLWHAMGGIQEAFPDIAALALQCHFTNCSHTTEKKCAVRQAIGQGNLPQDRYGQFLKLKEELEQLEQIHQRQAPTKHQYGKRSFRGLKRSGGPVSPAMKRNPPLKVASVSGGGK